LGSLFDFELLGIEATTFVWQVFEQMLSPTRYFRTTDGKYAVSAQVEYVFW
jgi:hypothetical protein